ncbi:M20 family metallopeptidase [Roseixanthobacter glucoisosaccharinicivorans]|uniref:M20 family metallopeptidase n=1 Tax=Roseixanthobacter glucoisosaccharinicivorans TaxID=3119923 RepID=UPI00372AC62A
MTDAIEIARALMRIDTCNPPGNEQAAADILVPLLAASGFEVEQHRFAPGRVNLVAVRRSAHRRPALAFTGHLDTVPLGTAPWHHDPFAGEISEGRLYGRGASDMKAAVAAFVAAAIDARDIAADLALVITAGEERGCEGALALARDRVTLPEIGGWIVAEPTSNAVALGHKGAVFCFVHFTGVSAHSSTPQLGVNAIYRACTAALAFRDLDFPGRHAVLGQATVNVGLIEGGHAPNAVPDRARLHVDVRTLPGMDHAEVLARLAAVAGDHSRVECVHDLAPVWTDQGAPFVALCAAAREAEGYVAEPPRGAAFFTDASVLAGLAPAPVVILGPGEPSQAHVTDEWCGVREIEAAQRIYGRLIRMHAAKD